MANSYFKFRQFAVYQEKCGMKVGTDGTLIGAWATGGDRILDIGTGTGLIALMMAQRYKESHVLAIDIDFDACLQAKNNVLASPFSDRIEILNISLQNFEQNAVNKRLKFNSIVCNPPFFEKSLGCPNTKRHNARHTDSLNFTTLLHCASQLVENDGVLNVVIPTDSMQQFDSAARIEGFSIKRKCLVKTTSRNPPKRVLIEYTKSSVEQYLEIQCLQDDDGNRSDWYNKLTEHFYLK